MSRVGSWFRIAALGLLVALVGGSPGRADPGAGVAAMRVAQNVATRAGTGVGYLFGDGKGLSYAAFLRYSQKLLQKHGGEEGIQLQDLADRELLGGLGGNLAAIAILGQLVPLLPIAPAFRETVTIAGGFLGWELGSGNLKNTDWLVVGTEIGVASGLRIALLAAGLSPGGIPMLLLTMEGATLAGHLVKRIRDGSEAASESADRLHPGVHVAARPDRPGSLATYTSGTGGGGSSGGLVNPLPSGGGYLGAAGDTYLVLVDQLVRGNRQQAAEALESLRTLVHLKGTAPSPTTTLASAP